MAPPLLPTDLCPLLRRAWRRRKRMILWRRCLHPDHCQGTLWSGPSCPCSAGLCTRTRPRGRVRICQRSSPRHQRAAMRPPPPPPQPCHSPRPQLERSVSEDLLCSPPRLQGPDWLDCHLVSSLPHPRWRSPNPLSIFPDFQRRAARSFCHQD